MKIRRLEQQIQAPENGFSDTWVIAPSTGKVTGWTEQMKIWWLEQQTQAFENGFSDP